MKIINSYLSEVLSPLLKDFIVISYSQEEVVFADIRDRLVSTFKNWSDLNFRKTVLLSGLELAEFHHPKESSREIRALVMVGVRNSIIEELHTQAPYGRLCCLIGAVEAC